LAARSQQTNPSNGVSTATLLSGGILLSFKYAMLFKKGMALWENELKKVGIKFEEVAVMGESVDLVVEWIIFDPEFLKNFIGRENLALREINNQTGEIRIQCNALLVFPFGEYTIREWAGPRTTEKQVDVEDTIAHEVGHALGLTHIGQGTYPLMAPHETKNLLTFHRLFADDISAVRKL
jgi:hypothetical protein